MRAQRRMQKSRLSRKGFSAAGTGVTSGSSLACVSQKARSSAAACDTCRRGVEMQSTRPNDLVPGKTPKSPPRILTTPCLTTPPGRDPPSHSSSFPRLLPQQSLAQTPPPPNDFPHGSEHLHAIDVHFQLQLLHGLASFSDFSHVVGHGCGRKRVKCLAGVGPGAWNTSGSPGE